MLCTARHGLVKGTREGRKERQNGCLILPNSVRWFREPTVQATARGNTGNPGFPYGGWGGLWGINCSVGTALAVQRTVMVALPSGSEWPQCPSKSRTPHAPTYWPGSAPAAPAPAAHC